MDASIPRTVLEHGLAIPFIRGTYHAEGSLYRRYSRVYNRHARVYSNSLVMKIRMKLMTLMNQVRTQLLNLGISPNRLTEKDGVFTLRITAQEEITRFLEVAKPRYKSHLPPARF
ncbi:MAG: LAGLIDADG family homing endonuclease [Nitrososphaerota archaeon]|nr:LAGLIDADG family homing endonuclease [Nitrososphaerota archaeon]